MKGRGSVGCTLVGGIQQSLFLLEPNQLGSAYLLSGKEIYFFVYQQQKRTYNLQMQA